jgi:mxaD protein
MKKILVALFASALSFPMAASASTAKTLKVQDSVEIKAPAADVWAKVNNFGDLGAWHPAVAKTEITAGKNNQKGAMRVLTLQDGGKITEKLTAYNAKKMTYTYIITEGVLPVSSYKSTVTVKAGKGGMTTVVWSGSFKRKDLSAKPKEGEDDETALKTIKTVYRAGLENVQKMFAGGK